MRCGELLQLIPEVRLRRLFASMASMSDQEVAYWVSKKHGMAPYTWATASLPCSSGTRKVA